MKQPPPIASNARGLRRLALAWLAGGVLLTLALLQGELLWWPASWPDGLGRGLYRVAYLLVAPVRILWIAAGVHGGHFILAWHCVLYGFSAPPFYIALAWLLHEARRIDPLRQHAAQHDPGETTTNLKPSPGGPRIGRRRFIQATLGSGAGLGLAAFPAYSVAIAPSRVRVREETIAIRGLPVAFGGLRLAHLSDTHYGPFISRQYLERVFDQVNALKPDLILLTGDYVYHTDHGNVPGIYLLEPLRARFGCLAVLGNHDHWEGVHHCRTAFEAIGIPLVDNRRMFLTQEGLLGELPSPDTPALCLAGLGDAWEDDVDYEAALRGVPDAMPRIVLSHNPDSAEEAPRGARIDLMLCGHTHGGQIRLPLVDSPLAPIRNNPKYLAGRCEGPFGPVIVSNGVGMSVLPLRIGAPPEFGLITLRPQ